MDEKLKAVTDIHTQLILEVLADLNRKISSRSREKGEKYRNRLNILILILSNLQLTTIIL